MIVVHHLENSRSLRVVWLLEELGLAYDIKHYVRDKATLLAPPELKAVHPLGKSPVITDGELTVAETGAIIEYLVGRYDCAGSLVPPAGTPQRLMYTYWLHYAEGSFMPLMVMTLIFSRVESGPMPFFVRPIAKAIVAKVQQMFLRPQTQLHLEYLEDHLRKNNWFAGEAFSAADVQMSFPIEAAFTRVKDVSSYPKLASFLARIHQRAAWQRATQRGGALNPLG